jgi:HD-GYP domain-containing protein (c-di-GMP phosphodiesterase class II)
MLCAPLQSLQNVRPIILCHHERLNGSGYPQALRGDEVPLLAQIVGIVDVYDALTSKRPYRDAWPSAHAARHLIGEVEEGKFARAHVEAFLDTLQVTGPESQGTRHKAQDISHQTEVQMASALITRRGCAFRGGGRGAAYRLE